MVNVTNLTNEKLSKLFDNPFELVNHAITLARAVIASGQGIGDGADRNSATQILKQILRDKQVEKQSQDLLDHEKQQEE